MEPIAIDWAFTIISGTTPVWRTDELEARMQRVRNEGRAYRRLRARRATCVRPAASQGWGMILVGSGDGRDMAASAQRLDDLVDRSGANAPALLSGVDLDTCVKVIERPGAGRDRTAQTLQADRHVQRQCEHCPMTPRHQENASGRRPTQAVRIVHLNAATFRALAQGDLVAANTASPVPLSPYFAGPDWRGVWQMRSSQVGKDPASAAWVTGVIWDERRQLAVGRAGYHGPPDEAGMVEIGYAVDPAYRRRGYARAALEALLQRAIEEPQIHTVRVTISPDNLASRKLALQYGFVEVGQQWDDEDGLEIIYEIPAGRLQPSLIPGSWPRVGSCRPSSR